MTKEVRVRYAPSPTGYLHIGNARTALFNYLFARNQNGKFIIRVEDTDQKRNVEGGEENQFHYLKWLGIDWDESVGKPGEYGPYRQSERRDIYEQHYNKLLENGAAYKCYCTEDELEEEREAQRARGEMPRYSGKCRHLTEEDQSKLAGEGRQPSIRFKVPSDKVYTFNDIVKNEVSFESNGIGDFVIVKKDGMPTYNFAVAVDDHLMEITHVLRGEDHISNTPKQMMIYEAFGWDHPVFGHMTLIVNDERKKLSKRDHSIIQYIGQYHDLGYLPEAMFNFIALLGWSPKGEEEIFTKEQFIEIFDPERLSTSPAVFDNKKLAWMNNQYMKEADFERVFEMALEHLVKADRLPADMDEEKRKWARGLVELYKEQMSFAGEIVELSEMFFKTEIEYDDEAMAILEEEQVPEVLQGFLDQIKELEDFEAGEIKKAIKATQKATGHKGKKLFMPIRVATTGQSHGPELPLAIELLGSDVVETRLEQLLAKLNG